MTKTIKKVSKKKVSKKPAVKPAKKVKGGSKKVKVSVNATLPTAMPVSTTKAEPKFFEGKKILRVLAKPAPKGFVLCEAMDGQTKVTLHVPKSALL